MAEALGSGQSSTALSGAAKVGEFTTPTEADFKTLAEGQELLKLCKRSKPHNRVFKVDQKTGQVTWVSPRKGSSKTTVNFDDVREIRTGQTTKTFKAHPNAGNADLSFSIVYGSKYETLDIISPSEEVYKRWLNALNYLVAEVEKQDKIILFLRQAWRKADRDKNNQLSIDEIVPLLHQLNVKLSRKQIKATFEKHLKKDGDGKPVTNTLDFDGFSAFYRDLKYRHDIEELFANYTKTHANRALTSAEFKTFLAQEQKQELSDSEVQELIEKYSDNFVQKSTLSLDGFYRYLTSTDTEAMNPKHFGQVYQRMDLPLNYYFINSSHNTYLLKDQLRGPSSVEAYVHALSKGCRCVELDCWDGPDGDPIIYHGHTLTSKIKFRDVIKTINEYAFVASPYPVVLSLEVHCKIEQQGKMAKIMRDILGEKLYVVPITEVQEHMPSPNDLKNKILVKGKALPPEVTKPEDYEDEESGDEDEEEEEEKNDPKVQEAKKLKEQQGAKAGGKVKVNKDLSDLVNCFKSAHFKSFEVTKEKGHPNEIFSFVETKSIKFAKHHPKEYIEFNSTVMTRTYPAGSRVDSSNYDPSIHWAYGCQVVALNYQTYDRPLQLNLGKFSDNGNSGYLIKPSAAMNYDSKIYEQKPLSPFKMTVRVISASQLPKPNRATKGEIIDPLIEVEMAGVEADQVKHRTKHVNDNGFNPEFNETFEFNVTVPELALLRFVVLDKDVEKDEFIATRTIPVTSLMPGYRHVSLFDHQHREIQMACINVHIAIQ